MSPREVLEAVRHLIDPADVRLVEAIVNHPLVTREAALSTIRSAVKGKEVVHA